MSAQQSPDVAAELHRAHRSLQDAHDRLRVADLDVEALHAALADTLRVTTTLSAITDELADQAPAVLDEPARHEVLGDLLADLKALRGCLTTGVALVEPALDDLARLSTPDGDEPDPAQPPPETGDSAEDDFARRWREWASFPFDADRHRHD
ncbi:hypothetical protein [Amycolatopsis anabasis]|uniref:hypothetical protein n=1 Tax=Amycolatopsis anabasis TaxID=1840409 RepID=UPI00131E1FD6|nr:hypothetical protein [Amycolatopsis anabasis]